MRILHCVPTVEGGGAERQLCYLAAGLVELGHDVHVAFMRQGELLPLLRDSGATLHWMSERSTFDARLITDLCRIIRATRADVVQTWLRRMDVTGGLASLAMRRPWVYSERTVWQAEGWRQSLRRGLIERASAVIANSENAAVPWRVALPGGPPVHVIPNALPLDRIAAADVASRAAWGVAKDAELLLYVGRFYPVKNTETLAAALIEVLKKRPRATAICCGPGELLPTFRRTLEEAGVGERVSTPGFRDDVWSLMKTADVLISTSRFEGQPNSVLEAMACGCPLVLSDIPGHRELVGDAAALYFSPASAGEAAAEIERVLDDRMAATERARHAFSRVNHQSMTRIAACYASVYESLSRSPHHRTPTRPSTHGYRAGHGHESGHESGLSNQGRGVQSAGRSAAQKL